MKNEELHDLIEKTIQGRLKTIPTDIAEESMKIKIDCERRKVSNSTILVDGILKVIEGSIKQGCENTVGDILSLQDELNIAFKKKNYKFVRDAIKASFQKLIQHTYDIENDASVLKLPFIKTREGRVEAHEASLLKEVEDSIVDAIEKDTKKQLLKKDDPALRTAKRANIIAFIAGIIALAALLYTLIATNVNP